MGLMPVLPRHLIDPETFEKTSFVPPIGSGPYLVGEVKPGTAHHLQARSELLGREASGQSKASSISTRSASTITVTPAACSKPSRPAPSTRGPRTIPRAGRKATTSRRCATAASSRKSFRSRIRPACRRWCSTRGARSSPISRVRQALIKLFDFEWINRTLYHGQYARSESYFARSELSSHGRAADEREKALLAPYSSEVKPKIMDGTFAFPVSDGVRRKPRGTQRGASAARRGRLPAGEGQARATRPARPSASRSSPPPEPRNGCCSPMPAP